MNPFDDFPRSQFQVIAPDGTLRAEGEGIFTPDSVLVFDPALKVAARDEIRRPLPSGMDDVFQVLDPTYYDSLSGIPAHYQIRVRRAGQHPHGQGGHYNINVHGPNSRVNIAAVDNSHNVFTQYQSPVFDELVEAIRVGVRDEKNREALIASVREMEAAHHSEAFKSAYQAFIQSAANHMTVITPLLPALTALL